MGRVIKNAVNTARDMIKRKINKNSIVIDATVGNGHDSKFLCSFLGENGKFYGFDIQKSAIDRTEERLDEKNYKCTINLFLDSHTEFKKHIQEEVDMIIYNLGYLPKGDKSITTLHDTSLLSVKEGMDILKKEGMIILTIYPGHDEGMKEFEIISSFLKGVNQKKFEVMKIEFFNQKNNPPLLFMIEKK